MILSGQRQLTGPNQAIKMGDYVIKEVVSTRGLGVQIDNALGITYRNLRSRFQRS